MIAVLMFVVLWVALGAMWVAALVSATTCSNEAFAAVGRSRTATIVLVAITGWVGGAYYWFVIKRQVEPHKRAAPPQLSGSDAPAS